MAFDKKDIAEQIKMMERQGALQSKLTESALEYAKHIQLIAELQKNINHTQEQINVEKKTEKEYTDEIVKLSKKNVNLSKDELKVRKEEKRTLLQKRAAIRTNTKLIEDELDVLKEITKEHQKSVESVSKMTIAYKEGQKFLEKTPGLLKKGYGKLKGYGLFEMDKAIRSAGVEMGKMASVGTAFGKDLEKGQMNTKFMGIHMKDLAKMQSSYSSELGRTVMLSDEGFDAMSQMAQGTILGAEGAASLAAEMDSFNISAVKTKDIVEDVTNMSATMGLNAGKVIKTLQSNLKMANKYHFKGGVAGMTKMAAQATKFNMSMETTAGFADKLFDIEGAVEMSAKLNTMGGEWAKLGDPMKLMYQARNDMEGLQTSVIDATAGMADFNEKTGEFSFSGLELHRMKELEKITGISAEQMAQMAKSKARFAKIGGQLGMEVDDDMKEFLENSSVFKDGEYKIKLSGKDELIPIRELTKLQKDQMKVQIKHDTATLKKRAENSQSFDDQLTNMLESTKTLLLPLLKGLNKQIPKIQKVFDKFMDSGLVDALKSSAEVLGFVLDKAVNAFMEFPEIITAIGLALMGPGKWILNGLALSKGFLMGGGGAGGAATGIGSNTIAATRSGKGLSGRLGKVGRGMAGKGMGIGAVGAIGAGVVSYGRSQRDDPDDNIGKGMGVASGALSGAATGAMIGSIIPIIGTAAGAIIGGVAGGLIAANGEYGDASKVTSTTGGTDKMKYGGMITEPINGVGASGKKYKFGEDGVKERVTPVGKSKPGNTSNVTTKIHVSFDTINIKSDDGSSGKIDLSTDSAFTAMFATKMKEVLSINANGGVKSPNPSYA